MQTLGHRLTITLLITLVGLSLSAQDHAGHAGGARETSHGGHEMTAEMLAVLRERIPAYRDYPDQQILLEMQMMGPDKSRYLSAPDQQGETGVLVLIHGFGPTGDRIMSEAVQPLAGIFPTSMSAGMSMMDSAHIQQSLDDLTRAGAETIVVVPMVSSKRNTLIHQWQYVFGERDRGAYYDAPQVSTAARVIMAEPPAEHPLITQIVLDHALELSADPAKEAVIIVAHGPIHADDNQAQLEAMIPQAARIRQRGGFASVEGTTLQDDAAPDIRARNVEKLRGMIETAQADGKRVLIVTDLLAAQSIQWKIERDLIGLDYEFSAKGISMHPNFTRWYQETILEAMQK
ncbi:MAG: hypothetical protein QNJ73_16770 [Gammaproteobacteria bacterium]|nr:hypothetical protein [Gammaproteobacteria bacterium]